MTINPIVTETSRDINHSVSLFCERDLPTHEEVQSLIDNAPDDKIALWIRLLHDTGLDRRSILTLERSDIRAFGAIRYLLVGSGRLFGTDYLMSPIRSSTARAIMTHDRTNDHHRRLFPGPVRDLGLEMVLGLRLAALRAGLRRYIRPETFRLMKIGAFRRANVRPDVTTNAIGANRGRGDRRPEETLAEAAEVLGEGPGLLRILWRLWRRMSTMRCRMKR